MSISQGLLGELDQELVGTRKVLERVPEAKLGWQPHPKSMTMGKLASHLSDVAGWGIHTMEADTLDIAPVNGPAIVPPDFKSVRDLLANFDSKNARLRTLIAAAPDSSYMVPWSLKMGGKVMFTMPRIAVMRSMIMNHAIHHRAQLTVYLRLNDVPVPGLYGPSADETNM